MERSTPIRQTNAQRVKRSTPTGRLVPNGRSDQPRPADWFPTEGAINPDRQAGVQRKKRSTPIADRVSSGRRAYHSNRRTGPRTESYVKSVVSIRAACEGPTSTPLRQHSLVGNRGRANHPPVGPVQQGSRTQVSMVGNLGQKPNSAVIVAVPGAAKEGLQDPSGKLPPNRSIKFTTNPPPGYRHNRPKVRRRRSSRFRRALRVS